MGLQRVVRASESGMRPATGPSAAGTGARTAATAAAVSTLALAVVCWIVAVDRMAGMDMGVATVVAAVIVAQKLVPPMPAIDVPLALAIVGLGIVIVIAPSSIPILTPPM
jgi:hypothetical protein